MPSPAPSSRRARRPRRPRRHLRWSIPFGAAAVALVVAASIVAVPFFTALQGIVSDGSAIPIGGSDAVVAVPARWTVHDAPDGLSVRSPDRVLTLEVAVVDADPDAALERLVAGLEAETGSTRETGVGRETLASGLDVTHVTVGTRGLAAVVGHAPSVTVSAVVGDGAGMDEYRRAVAEVLEGIRG